MLGQMVVKDQLRHANIYENQALLVRGFEASINPASQLVVLDSHTIIEKENSLFLVKPDVFSAIGISTMIFLQEDPKEIEKRRANDQLRKRPTKHAATLNSIQIQAIAQAHFICSFIGARLYIKSPSNILDAVTLLRQLQNNVKSI